MKWLRSSLRKWLGIGHEAELNNTVERLVARVGMLEANKAFDPMITTSTSIIPAAPRVSKRKKAK